MKKHIKFIIPIALIAVIAGACHKLDVAANSEYTSDVFPKTDAQFQSVVGPIYTQLRGSWSGDYFFSSECSTDEAILPAFGGNWLDGSKYQELHRHTWTKDNAWVNSIYSSSTTLTALCNQILYILKDAPASDAKNTTLSEVKTMRALGFWQLMDLFGTVSLDTTYPATTLNGNATRVQMFNYVESELKAAIPYLKTDVSSATYGRPTRYMAYALLAKMYINGKEYTGTDRSNDCIAACDSVINSGKYSIAARGSYLSMFYPTNGPGTSTPEFIFAIPYDASTSAGWMFYGRYDLNRNQGIQYSYSGSTAGSNVDPIMNLTKGNGLINTMPSGPRATLASYLRNFTSDANDIRLQQWLYGYQYWKDGTNIQVYTTKVGYNQFYTGSDAKDTIHYSLYIDTNIVLRQSVTTMDCGNDEVGWNQGARNIKFLPDASSTTRNQNNDVPVFRYADILLMKAEAILRGGTSTQTALALVNQVRSNRSTSAAWTSVTLDDLYKERCREFAWENWHRNDMIRFGHYEDVYGFKTNTESYRRLFPIPTVALTTNTKLIQNTGY